MLKTVLLASSMIVAVPAFAQETPNPDTTQDQQTAPVQDQAATPATDDAAPAQQDQATTAQANPQPNPAPAAQTAQPTPSQPAATASQPATEQPAATQEQVAQAVGRDFGTYDKDADGALSQTEFATWMGTLRKASEPSFNPGSPEAQTWSGQAFAAADTDKSSTINKQELTVFLTPKQPS